jgi:hypothetical protein
MLAETKNQFSLTRVASSTCGRLKSKFLSVLPAGLLLALLTQGAGACAAASLVEAPQAPAKAFGAWPDRAPTDCPFPKSAQFGGVGFTGRHAKYASADTWYPSWAADDKLYSPFTDGRVNDEQSGSGYNFEQLKSPVTGFAVIEGGDPLALKITRAGLMPHEPFPYGGQYPCGTIVLNGVWYYGTYCLDWQKDPWDTMGPFPGFNISTNLGQTWERETRTARAPLFGESAKDGKPVTMWNKAQEYAAWSGKSGTPGAKVKIGAPHFVDFGKNMEHSPDGKAYLVAQGSVRANALNSWAAADQVYLIRVKPSPETVNDPKAYEFFAGHDSNGKPVWSGDFGRIKPLLEWNDHMGIVTATYVPGLRRYLMCVTDGRGSKLNGTGPYDTYILESDTLTGPWKRVTYLKEFGAQAYFVNVPSKFISTDGRTLWVCYSHGWSCSTVNPPGSDYAMCLQEIRLLAPDEK